MKEKAVAYINKRLNLAISLFDEGVAQGAILMAKHTELITDEEYENFMTKLSDRQMQNEKERLGIEN